VSLDASAFQFPFLSIYPDSLMAEKARPRELVQFAEIFEPLLQ